MNWNLVLKVATGLFIIPIAVVATAIWPWWQSAPLFLRFLTSVFVLPIVALAYLTSFWWNNL
ncbi:MAG: hypothetical protein KBD24_00385 [Candidatus Pacebacteria bacterium]|nr:hypothetical protein [Candidatus Paceibacterota bacterium]